MGTTSATASPANVRPVAMPFVDRLASALVSGVPPIMVAVGMWFGWMGNLLNWQDLLILAVCYFGIGTGVTVGFHRLLTHQSFRCHSFTRATLAAVGSMAAEGPVIDWVATHRKHHQFSDVDGDPHSPHVGHGSGWRGAFHGLASRSPRLGVQGRPGGRRLSAATPRICSPTRARGSSIAPSSSGSSPGSPYRSRSASHSPGRRWRAHGTALGWRRAHLPPAPRDLLDQLALPLLRPPRLRHRR